MVNKSSSDTEINPDSSDYNDEDVNFAKFEIIIAKKPSIIG